MTTTTKRAAGLAVLAASAAAVAIPSAASAVSARAASTKTVHIVDIAYKPRKLTIRRGTTVKWSFDDQIVAHTVTSTGSKRFKSSPQKMNGTYKVTFRKPGTYRYHCLVHPNVAAMKGTIIVK
ncbi:cupredoxin domain-containing protein [Paraconexibacter antarcticus]|uniref:Cupredoxin domain-containing protein n=1 Tax=Paraconexibacter antarcticus TaxID=2949664 RepID=A0ABY5DTA7_9ACTN|nr:cupredoxin domain-containing protein [Paraconexibacter antarcticus]UTI64186.1 cupredoxin domain-containing protein [Paraconexibacter antarcticus]